MNEGEEKKKTEGAGVGEICLVGWPCFFLLINSLLLISTYFNSVQSILITFNSN